MGKFFIPVMILCLACLVPVGCVSVNLNDVALLPDGRFVHAGDTYSLQELGPALKSSGLTSHSQIKVSVTQHTPQATVTRIGRSLAAAGFPRVRILKPVKPEAIARIEMRPGGIFVYSKRKFRFGELGRALIEAGVDKSTPVRIVVPNGTAQADKNAIRSRLTASGYTIVTFASPLKP